MLDAILDEARKEARRAGSVQVDVEHVLLAALSLGVAEGADGGAAGQPGHGPGVHMGRSGFSDLCKGLERSVRRSAPLDAVTSLRLSDEVRQVVYAAEEQASVAGRAVTSGDVMKALLVTYGQRLQRATGASNETWNALRAAVSLVPLSPSRHSGSTDGRTPPSSSSNRRRTPHVGRGHTSRPSAERNPLSPSLSAEEAKMLAEEADGAMQEERWEDAIALYRDLLGRGGETAPALNNLGVCLMRSRRPDEAVDVLERAVALDPKLADAYANLGIVLIRDLGRSKEGERHLRRALALAPAHPVRLFLESHHLVRAGKGEAVFAVRRPEPGKMPRAQDTQLSPEDMARADAMEARGDLEGALAIYREFLEAHPRSLSSLNNAATLLSKMRRPSEARFLLETALAINPKYVNGRRSVPHVAERTRPRLASDAGTPAISLVELQRAADHRLLPQVLLRFLLTCLLFAAADVGMGLYFRSGGTLYVVIAALGGALALAGVLGPVVRHEGILVIQGVLMLTLGCCHLGLAGWLMYEASQSGEVLWGRFLAAGFLWAFQWKCAGEALARSKRFGGTSRTPPRREAVEQAESLLKRVTAGDVEHNPDTFELKSKRGFWKGRLYADALILANGTLKELLVAAVDDVRCEQAWAGSSLVWLHLGPHRVVGHVSQVTLERLREWLPSGLQVLGKNSNAASRGGSGARISQPKPPGRAKPM